LFEQAVLRGYGISKKTVLKMKLTVIVILVAILSCSAADGYTQSVTLNERGVSIEQVLKMIQKQTGYGLFYDASLFDKSDKLNINIKNASVQEALQASLRQERVSFSVVNGVIIIKPMVSRPASAPALEAVSLGIDVTGRIVGEDGFAIAGVSVQVKGSLGKGTVSNSDGRFVLTDIDETAVLIVSGVNIEPREVKVGRKKDLGNIIVSIKIAAQEEVKVISNGYQTLNKNTFTGTAVAITGEELKRVSTQNLFQAIQVLDPSFRLLDNNFAGSNPNSLPTINVRGTSALPTGSNDILRRDNITGMANMPAFILDGYEVNVQKIFDLDLNRVASVTLLKDAAATAIYGSRAANGVLVIVTKLPKEGKLQFSYQHETNIMAPDLTGYDVLNAAEKLEYEKKAGVYTAAAQNTISQDELDELYYHRYKNVVGGVNTYWLSQPLRTAIGQKHGLSLEGGSNTFRYGADLRYQTRPGVMKGSGRDQYSGGMFFSYNLNNKIRFQNELSITSVQGRESPYGSFTSYVTMNPYYPKTDENGNTIQNVDVWTRRAASGTYIYDYVLNPMYNATLSSFDKTKYNEILNNFATEIELVKNLKLRGQISMLKRMSTGDRFVSPLANEFYFYEAARADERGSYTSSGNDVTTWDGNLRLNWIKQTGGHVINLVAGSNIRTDRSDAKFFTAIGFPNDRFTSIGFAKGYAENGKPGSSLSESRLFGVFSSVNYSFKNRYLLDGTVRIDGSSLFGANNRTAPFGSFGVGWNVDKENWFNIPQVSQLRLRFTTGLTGSVQFAPFMAQTTYSYDQNNWYSSGLGAYVNTYGNSDLSWQKTTNMDWGVDLGLFQDRIFLSSRVYRKLTRDILTDISIAPSTGFSTYKDNLGDMENNGFEVNLRANIIQNKTWTVGLMGNFARNTNKIVKISNSLKSYNERADEAQQGDDLKAVPLLRYNEGQSIYAIYAVPSLGIDPENGKEIFVKRDGSLTYEWDARDITVVGENTPKLEGSFGATLRYKQLMMVAFFQTRFGGDMYNQTLVDRVENADPRYNVDRRVLEQKWQQPGDVAFYKNIADLGTTRVSSRFVMPDNLINFSSLNLTYDVDPRLASRLSLTGLRFGVTANDLARWSSVRIERGIDYPFARNISITLQAIF
jgi:TonB-linked SusC/RagA family outer membrane protein